MGFRKVYVEVGARFPAEGGVVPLYLVWSDGRKFSVEKVKCSERASARVGAILPVRFTCVIGGAEKWLYFEPSLNRWFVEQPV